MKTPTHLPSRRWILVALGILWLCAHGFVFYFVRRHWAFSATLLSGVAVLVAIKHLGVFSSWWALVRKTRGVSEAAIQRVTAKNVPRGTFRD
jgi:hypothetical protein